jgi:hypothetical protein
MKVSQDIASQLRGLSSMEDEGQLKQLQNLLDSLSVDVCSKEIVSALFDLFERFPDSDGYGMFWTIVHFLEAGVDYESELLASVKRNPCEFNLMMVNRLINGKVKEIAGENLLEVLKTVAMNERADRVVQALAHRFLAHQRAKGQDV